MNDPIRVVLERLQGVKRSGESGSQWTALCPAHEDTKHSLGIGIGREGKILLRCYAGCRVEDIVRAMRLEWG